MARSRFTDVFTLGFWVNYLVSLLATIWIPAVHLTFKNEETGEVISESTLRLYRVYLDLIQDPTAVSAYKYVAFHLGIVFVVTYAVWYVVLYRSGRSKSASDATES